MATLTGDRYPSIDFTEIFYRITQTNASMRKAYERSVVLAEQQCGHGILHLPCSKALLYPNHPPDGKLARNLTEPFT